MILASRCARARHTMPLGSVRAGTIRLGGDFVLNKHLRMIRITQH